MIPWLPVLLLAGAPAAHASTHAAGATIENAATLDITPDGFDAIVDILPGLLPSEIAVSDMGDSYEGALGQCWLGGYEYSLSGMAVGLQVDSARIVPQTGYLELTADLEVQIEDVLDPFELYIEAECVGDTCYGYVDPFHASITTTITLDVVTGPDGEPVLDATVGDIALDYDLAGDDIHLSDCWIDTVYEVLDFFGIDLYDLILGLASGYIDGAVSDFGPEIEALLEDAFAQATVTQQLDVQGITVDLELFPADVEIVPAGVRLALNGSMATDAQAACIVDYDPGASLATPTDPPQLGGAPAGVDTDYHVAMSLSDDIGNQALYALWRGGLLCYTIDEETFPVDTNVLGLLAGDSFDELFPDSMPMVIETRPRQAPTLVVGGDDDAGVHVEDLGLEFYAELDHRQALIVGMDLEADVGVNLELDGTTGDLAVGMEFATDDLSGVVSANEFAPDANADIEQNFGNVFETLAGSLLGSALDGLAFTLPSFDGVGLVDLQVSPAGDEGDWVGAYAWLGPVTYASGGCGDTGGCGGGCATNGTAPSRVALLLALPLGLALLRRREG